MKHWLTAREIAECKLPELPVTARAIAFLAKRQGWNDHPAYVRKRKGRGGGKEYNIELLPEIARVIYVQKHSSVGGLPAVTPTGGEIAEVRTTDLSASAKLERDARKTIVHAFNSYRQGMRSFSLETCRQVFADKYQVRSLAIDDWVVDVVSSFSKRTLRRWCDAVANGSAENLAVDKGSSRRGSGVLDRANEGEVKAFILALVAHRPHLSGQHLRDLCRSEFGDKLQVTKGAAQASVAMPSVRLFQMFVQRQKVENKVVLTKLQNPDLYRSTMAPSGRNSLAHIKDPNQLWQIDASPIDALCIDGRHSIYACIDISTRRALFLVSRTPRATAVASLIRKASLAWGVPQTIKTDNGSDFIANDTKRLFAALNIHMELSDAYSPQQKGHVERLIKTFQHDFVTLLPGFIGHNVADRTAIENRKSFAQRLGQSDTDAFDIQLDGHQLQELVDLWVEKVYLHRPHGGLNGKTPADVNAASEAPISRVDERALDLLLHPVAGTDGQRTVTKFGVRINNNHYFCPGVLPTTRVFVRQDPHDMGRAKLFEPDGGKFLGDAICAELAGINPAALAKANRELQAVMLADATRGIKRNMREIIKGPTLIQRQLEVAMRDAPNVVSLPKPEITHETPQITAAIDAITEFGEQLNPTAVG